jgi:hypothetical protein
MTTKIPQVKECGGQQLKRQGKGIRTEHQQGLLQPCILTDKTDCSSGNRSQSLLSTCLYGRHCAQHLTFMDMLNPNNNSVRMSHYDLSCPGEETKA